MGKDDLKLGLISTMSKKEDMALLSDVFFDKISNYSMNPQKIPLRTFLSNLNECSYLERLYFYQLHILKGKPLNDKLIEGEFPNDDSNGNSSPEATATACICTYVAKATRDFGLGHPWNWSFDTNDNIYSDYSTSWVQEGVTSRAWSNSGAAKWQ